MVTPDAALARVVHCLDRANESGYRPAAFARACEAIRSISPDEVRERAETGTLTELAGVGDTSATVITEALTGEVPRYLVDLEARSTISVTPEGAAYLQALRGDCHLHSTWSDGGAPIRAMVATAIELGHEYMVLTDHSARLTVAHGLDEVRLAAQIDEVAALNAELADTGSEFRVLAGMEVDILIDGSLDLSDEMLARLDVVVASVHSKLRMDRSAMTDRMVRAVSSPHVDILGHCTGRLIGKRPPSEFDADAVFSACVSAGTAVEINCRLERLDPPRELLSRAVDHGCWFSIDTDAHSTGQLEWQPHGCDRAAQNEVPVDRIINTLSADDLVAWAAA